MIGQGKRHLDFCWEPRKRVANASGTGVPHPDGVTAGDAMDGPNIPAVRTVWGPSGTFPWLDVNHDTNASGWDKGVQLMSNVRCIWAWLG